MQRTIKVIVVVILILVLGALGWLMLRAFTTLVVTGVRVIGSDEGAALQPAETAPARAVTTLPPGDDPSWARQEDNVRVDVTAEELARRAESGAQADKGIDNTEHEDADTGDN
ncbi:MAG: hypothetical protein IJJ23_09345 [Clostridia bacterium]|nr:hypothetical protein [Clostridia bacterium]